MTTHDTIPPHELTSAEALSLRTDIDKFEARIADVEAKVLRNSEDLSDFGRLLLDQKVVVMEMIDKMLKFIEDHRARQ